MAFAIRDLLQFFRTSRFIGLSEKSAERELAAY